MSKMILALCTTCGTEFLTRDRSSRGQTRYFCCGKPTGRLAARWKGGIQIDRQRGRAYITCRDGTSMAYYRAVAAAGLGRLLRDDEVVHHINGDPSDDRPENLMVLTAAEHVRIHAPWADLEKLGKLDWPRVREIRRMLAAGSSCAAVSRLFDVSTNTIYAIRDRKWWRVDPLEAAAREAGVLADAEAGI